VDELIERLRARLADPERRIDARADVFSAQVQAMSLDQLFSAGRSAAADLLRVVASNQAGRMPDLDLIGKADQIQAAMRTPLSTPMPLPASEAAVADAERRIGRPLPAILRRLALEVADGGFGPGGGLLSLERMASEFTLLTAVPQGPRDQPWPKRLLPIVDMAPGYDCLDLDTGRMVAFDPEDIEGDSDRQWQAAFHDVAPTLDAYLRAWRDRPDPYAEAHAAAEASMVDQARQSRAMIAAMTPQERAAMGLPEVGWERVVWGGLGLDEDGSASA
jgi:hypothetical protein